MAIKTRYKLVQDTQTGLDETSKLEAKVNKLLFEGWKLHGNPFVVEKSVGGGHVFAQAMTLEETL